MIRTTEILIVFALALHLLASGCSENRSGGASKTRPNVIWIVWDTVRADHMSLYGYELETTPRLDQWAAKGRVFDNCISTAPWTVPSHASMFTGLLPSEHDTDHHHPYLGDAYTTVAEQLQAAGYRTFLYSANPHVSSESNLQQGFEFEEHPWDERYADQAMALIREKLLPCDQSALARSVRNGTAKEWSIKASGSLAQTAVERFLVGSSESAPYFIFLNYMEAHEPYIPARRYRERMMTAAQIRRSCTLGPIWPRIWLHTFGLREIEQDELRIQGLNYDACIAELDDLLGDLLDMLSRLGQLESTIVVLTSDHGEHLGEHHMLNHQYALYEPLIRVPMILYYPDMVDSGRDSRPVVNFDVYTTLLKLAGLKDDGRVRSRSLLDPDPGRVRMSEYSAVFEPAFRAALKAFPDWNPNPWRRTLRAVLRDQHKLIWSSDGRHELYDLAVDPGELRNRFKDQPVLAAELMSTLEAQVAEFARPFARDPKSATDGQAHRDRLRAVGYAGDDEAE